VYWFDTCAGSFEQAGLARYTDAEGITLDTSFPSCNTCASLDEHDWGSLSFKLSAATPPSVAVAVAATRSCRSEKSEAEAVVNSSLSAGTSAAASLGNANKPYQVKATLPAKIPVNLGALGTDDVVVSLDDAVLTLTSSHDDDTVPLPAFDAVDWSAELSGDVDVVLPNLGVKVRGLWTKSFTVSGGKPKLESGKKYVIDGTTPAGNDGGGGDKVEVTAGLAYESQGVTLTGEVLIVLPAVDNADLFAGDGELTLVAEKSADADSSAPATSVRLQPLNVSVTYNSDGQTLAIEGAGGVMELSTVVVTGVEVSLKLSYGGAENVTTISGTMEGKVAEVKDADFVNLPGVPELKFDRIAAAVELDSRTSEDSVTATDIVFDGKVNHRVTGKYIAGKQTFFTVQGDLQFDFPCVSKISSDLIAWGEVPGAVTMHDTNVTFEYDCGNMRSQIPYWTINGGSEEPYAANTLYLGSTDFVEVESLKVQGLAYRKKAGTYYMSNLFFGTVSSSGSSQRNVGERTTFSINTEEDKKLKEVEAVHHETKHLKASMMFRAMDTSACEDHGVIGTARVSVSLGVLDACGVNAITRGRVHAVHRCGSPAKLRHLRSHHGRHQRRNDRSFGGVGLHRRD